MTKTSECMARKKNLMKSSKIILFLIEFTRRQTKLVWHHSIFLIMRNLTSHMKMLQSLGFLMMDSNLLTKSFSLITITTNRQELLKVKLNGSKVHSKEMSNGYSRWSLVQTFLKLNLEAK